VGSTSWVPRIHGVAEGNVKVAGCQVPDVRNDPERAVAIVRARTMEAQQLGATLVTFPECFLQGYDVGLAHVSATAIDLSGAGFAGILHALRALDAVIVLGLIERDSSGYYNAAVVVRQGRLLARYRKRHLLEGERAVFGAGQESPVVDVGGMLISVSICYDLQFSDSPLAAAHAGARVLACPCNNMLRSESAERWKWKHNETRSKRAREANVWIVSADVTGERDGRISYGPTAVIAPDGNVLSQVPLLAEGIALAEIDL
jgi:predicted amidohydrolase